METIQPLPARERLLPGESLASLLRRTSDTMGYESVRRLLGLVQDQSRLPWNINHLSPGPALEALACLLKTSPGELLQATVHRFGSALVLSTNDQAQVEACDRKTILRYFSAGSPVCPHCLRDDPVPHDRLIWSFRPIPICTHHGVMLIDRCSACGQRLRPDRDHQFRCRCGRDLRDVQPAAVSNDTIDLSQQVEGWLSDQHSPLAKMTTAACLWWAERLAKAAGKTPTWMRRIADELGIEVDCSAESLAWLAAFQILTNWPDRLETFLNEFQRVPKYQHTSTGIGRSFGSLLRHVAQLEQLGFATPADALRKHLLRHYKLGHLSKKVCLFQTTKSGVLSTRTWMTQTEAAKSLRLRHGAVVDLIEGGILTGEVHQAGRSGRSVGLVSRDSVDQLKRDLKTAIGTVEAAKRLGISRHRVLDLNHAGLLPRTVRTSQGWRIPKIAIESVESIYRILPTVKQANSGWLTARQATRQFGPGGLTFVRLLQQVQMERIRARRLERANDFAGLLVSKTDLERVMPDVSLQHFASNGCPLHSLAKILFSERPMKEPVLKKWIQLGLLNAQRAGRAQVVAAEEVERFRSTYCLFSHACKILGISRATLARWETDGRIQPVYGRRVTPGAGFSLYRRADLEHLQAERVAGRFRRAA